MKAAKIDEYPELKDTLAEMLAEGVSQQEIADALGVADRGTIATWKARPEIQQRVTKIISDRANSILRHTTKRIEGMLNSGKKITLKDLLQIHREFAGQTVNVNMQGDEAKAMQELLDKLYQDPDLAESLGAVLGDSGDAD